MNTPRWYMLNKMGMATLCNSKKDAAKEARAMDMAWPHMGPHRAVQLVEAEDVEALRAGDDAARLEIESLRARCVEPAGEYPALPEPATHQIAEVKSCEHGDAIIGWRVEPSRQSFNASMLPKRMLYTADQMRAYVDADRAMLSSMRPYTVALVPADAPTPQPSPAAQGDALDAARYAIVRRGQHWSVIDGLGDPLTGDRLDAAVDAVCAAQEGKSHG